MTGKPALYVLMITPTARRQLTENLPEAVAAAADEFITGPLLADPHRVGQQLRSPLEDRDSTRRGTYRVGYWISDDERTVTVVDIARRRDAYRPRALMTVTDRRTTARSTVTRRRSRQPRPADRTHR